MCCYTIFIYNFYIYIFIVANYAKFLFSIFNLSADDGVMPTSSHSMSIFIFWLFYFVFDLVEPIVSFCDPDAQHVRLVSLMLTVSEGGHSTTDH